MDLGDTKCQLRIVLMGHRRAGKSSTGNSIMGREVFDLKRSAQCVRRHGDVVDTHITVIEAPGWWRNHTLERSPEILKQELVFSVSQCPPGPHTLLLIIRADTKVKDYVRKSVEAHVSLLGERVWSHTIVVFTCGDSLSDTSIEQHIESEGQELQRLLDKCGNRYHVLNNKNRSNDTQIKELLEKIEETVVQNKGFSFEVDRKILQEMKERRRAEEERAEIRMKRIKKQRENIRSQMSDSHHLSELRIVLMGYSAVGKSSAGNSILGRDVFELKRSAQCVRRRGKVADTHITVIEAPGWWINHTLEESPEILKQEIVFSVSQCPPGPHALLLIIRVDTGYKDYMRKSAEAHMSLLGERVWSHSIVVFARGDYLSDTSIEQHIESEGQELQRLLDKCGNRYHVLNNQNRSDYTQIKELLEKIEETVMQNNGHHFETEIRTMKQQENVKSHKVSGDEQSDTSIYLSSHSRDSGVQRKSRSMELPPLLVSGDAKLDTSIYLSSHSRDSGVQRKSHSMELPPLLVTENKHSDTQSLGSSASSSFKSLSGPDGGSAFSLSHSSLSSGYVSLQSISESVEQTETTMLDKIEIQKVRSQMQDGASTLSLSHSCLSSEFVSLQPIPESVEQSKTRTKVFSKTMGKHDKHEEETDNT